MQAHVDDHADDVQPVTLAEWQARRHAELAAIRALAHRDVDAFFDAHEQRIALDAERIERDVDGLTQH